jgi:ABC-type dipeptide/oligopeptide/nickel transport system permease subunit
MTADTTEGRRALPSWRVSHVNGHLLLSVLVLGALSLLALFPGWLATADPADCSLSRSLGGPAPDALFGFDEQGCDYFAQTLYGTRTSFTLALVVILGTTLIALVIGSVAGFVGGRVDVLLSRLTDVWSGIPLLLGGIIVLTGTDSRGLLQVAAVLIVFGWPPMVRVLRASVREIRERDYVTAARALGARPARILLRHVLPNALRPLIIFASAYAGVIIAAEATLTFAGAGLARPTQSWGLQLFVAQDRIGTHPHLLIFPGAFVVLTVTGFVLLGEGLRRQTSLTGR